MRRLPPRTVPERMDDPAVDAAALGRALEDLARLNRLFGTRRRLVRLARALPPHPSAPYRLLDVAAGGADLPRALLAWGERHGRPFRAVAVDRHLGALGWARYRTPTNAPLAFVAADARALPWPDRAFDLVLCTTALHHFDDDDAVAVLRELRRVCRGRLVVEDLRRHPLALAAAHVLAATLWRRSPLPRHDGPLSVRRAFTAAELRALATAAGLVGARVRRVAPFRLLLLDDAPACPAAAAGPS